jgi:hypothetical protein
MLILGRMEYLQSAEWQCSSFLVSANQLIQYSFLFVSELHKIYLTCFKKLKDDIFKVGHIDAFSLL